MVCNLIDLPCRWNVISFGPLKRKWKVIPDSLALKTISPTRCFQFSIGWCGILPFARESKTSELHTAWLTKVEAHGQVDYTTEYKTDCHHSTCAPGCHLRHRLSKLYQCCRFLLASVKLTEGLVFVYLKHTLCDDLVQRATQLLVMTFHDGNCVLPKVTHRFLHMVWKSTTLAKEDARLW